MVADCGEPQHQKELIVFTARLFVVHADVDQQRSDEQNVDQIHPIPFPLPFFQVNFEKMIHDDHSAKRQHYREEKGRDFISAYANIKEERPDDQYMKEMHDLFRL